MRISKRIPGAERSKLQAYEYIRYHTSISKKFNNKSWALVSVHGFLPSSLVIYQRNYIRSSSTRSTNFEAFKTQMWKLLMRHVVLILWATSIILLHRRPSVRIMSSNVRIMHIIHSMHTLAYICYKILTFHDKSLWDKIKVV